MLVHRSDSHIGLRSSHKWPLDFIVGEYQRPAVTGNAETHHKDQRPHLHCLNSLCPKNRNHFQYFNRHGLTGRRCTWTFSGCTIFQCQDSRIGSRQCCSLPLDFTKRLGPEPDKQSASNPTAELRCLIRFIRTVAIGKRGVILWILTHTHMSLTWIRRRGTI